MSNSPGTVSEVREPVVGLNGSEVRTPDGLDGAIVIEAGKGWQFLDLRELAERTDLLYFMTMRGIKGRFAQSALGFGWAVIQPVATMLIFTLIFGRVARVPIPWDGPYAIFAFCGIVPWSFFSGALSGASGSLIGAATMISKIYIPRVILPLSNVLARFIDLGITLVILLALMLFYGLIPRPEAMLLIPVAILITATLALGVGLWLASMAVQYRDVAHGLGFIVQIGMYLSPVIYDVTSVPDRFRYLFGLNPMVGVITTFRASLLGLYPVDWLLLVEAAVVSLLAFISGGFYFRKSERLFADVA